MLKKINNDLMILNKYLIFFEDLVDEDVDYNLFSTKIFSDITFINGGLNMLFDEFVKYNSYFDNENILKIYYSSLKRFYRILLKVLKNYELLNSVQRDISSIIEIRDSLEKKMESIKSFNNRKKIISKDKQCINEEEYSLLLESIDENV
ncbi:MAG TPA: hypothetical protein PLE45_06680 [Spirochaetota bacterium]|nr:hypothetical protein [Spirochaetota bacterium]HPP04362.1 hypothetical protein [Spirochaetota bacterium]